MPLTPENKTRQYLDLGHSEAENHAKTQQKLYETHVAQTSSVTRKIDEFFKTNILGFTWHYLKSRFGKRHAYQFYPTQSDTGIYRLQPSVSGQADSLHIALLSDWANDTVESDQVAHLVAKNRPDYTLHLGDVYFVGAPKEVEENFTAPHASWYYGESGSLALAGNHEMYSNGNGFFNHLLPSMYAADGEIRKTQQAGFFCLENDHWRILGLDTGYTSVRRPFMEVLFPPDCHFRKEQTDWLQDIVRIGDPADKRGLVILTHHPVISGFRKAYPQPARQLAQLLGKARRPVVWFWGHEHRLIWYELQEMAGNLPVYGRCIGNGGMPVETALPAAPGDRAKIAFYDRRIRKQMGRHRLGYNGYTNLQLNGAEMQAVYYDLEGTLLMKEAWEVSPGTGHINWKILEHLPALTLES